MPIHFGKSPQAARLFGKAKGRGALAEIPPRVLHDIASNERTSPEHLAMLVRAIDEVVLITRADWRR